MEEIWKLAQQAGPFSTVGCLIIIVYLVRRMEKLEARNEALVTKMDTDKTALLEKSFSAAHATAGVLDRLLIAFNVKRDAPGA